MKKVFALTVVALLSIAVSAKAADLKIGVVNFQKALNEVEQGKKAKGLLKSEFDAKQKKLNLQQEELKKMQGDFEGQKSVLSQDALATKQKTFNDKYVELQKNMEQYRADLLSKDSKITSQILQNLRSVVQEIGQKGGFTLVVEASQDAVLYVQSKEDLTTRVISDYNKKFSGPLKTE